MPNRRPPRAALALVVLGSACAAARLPDDPVIRPYELSQFDIPAKSGLRILIQEDHSAPIVVVSSVYGVGSTGDPRGVEGLAHLVEHLAFRTKPFEQPLQLWDHLKRLGADFNASTSTDFTSYYAIAHKDNLDQLLQLEAWRLLRTVDGVTPEVFATEREVVRNELRQRGETTIGSKMFDEVLAALFPAGHPLARPIGGTHESLSAATLEHARAFAKQHYRPDNCTIVIAGDVSPQEVKRLLGKWPAELLFGPGGPQGPAVPPRKRVGERDRAAVPQAPAVRDLKRHKGPVVQPTLIVAWALPGAYQGNDALLQFVSARLNLALGQGVESKEEDDIEGLGAFAAPLADASLLLVEADLKPGADPDKARQRVLDALVNAWTTELGRVQTEASRWFAATDLLLVTASPVGAAIALAEHLAATGRSQFFKDTLLNLLKVKSGEVTDLAYRWLKRERAVSVYFEPENDEVPKLVGGGGGGAAAPGSRRATHDIGRELSKAVGDLGPERIRQVAAAPGLTHHPRFTLANGLEVVAIRHGSAPVAEIFVGIHGGEAIAQPYGLASFAWGFARPRSTEHGDLMAVGGGVGSFMDLGGSTHVAQVISGNLPNGIAVLSDRLASNEVDEEFFLHRGRMIDRAEKRYQRLSKLPDFLAGRRLWSELYPGHPYGTTFVEPATLKSIRFEDAAAFVRAHLRPENALAVVVGDVRPDEVKALAEKYLARWPGGGGRSGARFPPPAAPPTARKVFLIDRPEATQALVRIACRLADARPESLPAYHLVESIAGELAWSVREQWGATYGVHATVGINPGGAAHLLVGGAIENKQVGSSVAKLLDFVADIGSERLDEGLFLVKRWDRARAFAREFATGAEIASAITQAHEFGWPADVWDRYPERLAATTRESVRAIMKDCVGREIVTVVGQAASVRPQLVEAGLKLEPS